MAKSGQNGAFIQPHDTFWQSSVPMLVLSRDQHVLASNRAASQMLGLDKDGQRFSDFIDDTSKLDRLCKDAWSSTRGIPAALCIHTNGGETTYRIFGRRVHCFDGIRTAILLEFRDAENANSTFQNLNFQNRELQNALSRAQEAHDRMHELDTSKSRFLATVGHEIRTPLNGILGMSRVLLMSELQEDQQEWAECIVESGESLLEMLNRVLDYSKFETDEYEIRHAEVTMSAFFSSIIYLLRPVASSKGITFLFDTHSEMPEALAFDSTRVQQCLNNLISNSIKFTDKGRVRVAANFSIEGDAVLVTITVSDTGEGISQENIEHIFLPYAQASDDQAKKHAGTGLGLSISRLLARRMGGDVTVESSLGKGSKFTFHFRAKYSAGENKSVPLRA